MRTRYTTQIRMQSRKTQSLRNHMLNADLPQANGTMKGHDGQYIVYTAVGLHKTTRELNIFKTFYVSLITIFFVFTPKCKKIPSTSRLFMTTGIIYYHIPIGSVHSNDFCCRGVLNVLTTDYIVSLTMHFSFPHTDIFTLGAFLT